MPLPAFLLLHLASELRLAFATDVSDVVRGAPSLFVKLSLVPLVWLPLAVHVGLGCFLLLSRRERSRVTGDVPAMPRAISRISAYHARAFALAVWLGEAAAEDAGFRLLGQLASSTSGVPLVGGLYLLGLLATVTHAGLGVHRGLLAEGLLSTAEKRQASAVACAAFGVLSFGIGAAAVIRVASGVLLR